MWTSKKSNTFLNFTTLGTLVLAKVDVAEWLRGLFFKRGVLNSNSDAAAITTTNLLFILKGFPLQFNQRLDFLLQDMSKNVAIPRIEKRDQWIARLKYSERTKLNDDWNSKKRFEVLLIGTEDRLKGKRSTSQGSIKFVPVFGKVYQAVNGAHALSWRWNEKYLSMQKINGRILITVCFFITNKHNLKWKIF